MFVCALVSSPIDARAYYEGFRSGNKVFCDEIGHVLISQTPRWQMGWHSYGPPHSDGSPPCPWEEPLR